jgi:ATP-dependent Lon protease
MTLEKSRVPVVPLRGLAVLPGEVIHCDIGRKKTLSAIEQALSSDGLAMFCAQADPKLVDVQPADFASVGTVCRIRQVFRIQGDTIRLLVTGVARARIEEMVQSSPCFLAEVSYPAEHEPEDAMAEALRRSLGAAFSAFAEMQNRLTTEQRDNVLQTQGFGAFTDAIGRNVAVRLEDKQALLEEPDAEVRALSLLTLIRKEMEIMQMERRIAGKVKEAVEQNQREFVLREQLRAVQEELGGEEDDAAEYRARMEQKALPETVRAKLEKEIDRLAALPRGSHEQPMAQAYIECILDLPWTERTEDNLDLANARAVLDADHYGMEPIKKRILEMLAVQKLTGNPQGQILCLVGPPGVGKTSIASAIAKAMGRRFVRMSLGGVRDEAEIRGHRRTYIGAQPGRVIAAMRQAGTVNPLLLFDEIDKLAYDIHGDPSAAMLEVLDSAQNNTFTDHFLELPYDLSQCLLMTTANDADHIPGPLRDRMEMIEVPSYLFDEKMEIARRHLLPRQMEKNGLKRSNLRVDDRCLARLIEGYTREAGVRQLERVLGSVCRKAACEVVDGRQRVQLSLSRITEWLGPVKYRREPAAAGARIGAVTGLAWTPVGGETLEIEVSVMPGKGNLQLTGQLGDVMQESARAALTYVRAHAAALGIEPDCFDKIDVHIHVPEGAVPKDGPSAGIAMMTALASALSGVPVRAGVAMTGEITLRGHVLPIGGLREKLLAAVRADIPTVLLPAKNRESLHDVPQTVLDALEIVFVDEASDVLAHALAQPPVQEGAAVLQGEEAGHAAVCH